MLMIDQFIEEYWHPGKSFHLLIRLTLILFLADHCKCLSFVTKIKFILRILVEMDH